MAQYNNKDTHSKTKQKAHPMSFKKVSAGFTIVELLVVIVVIAILAAISIVAYRGIQDKARETAATTAASQAAKKIAAYYALNEQYPTTLADANISATDGKFQYSFNNTATPPTYCVTATEGQMSYFVDGPTGTPKKGGCAGHGSGGVAAITNLVLNPNASGSSGWASNGSVSGGYVTGFNGSTRAYRMTRTTTGAAVIRGTVSEIESSANYTVVISLRSDISTTVFIQLRGTSSSNDSSTLGTVELTANQPQTVTVSGNTWNGTHTSPNVSVAWSAGVANNWVEVTQALVVRGQYSGNYGDGSSPNWVWNGTVNASTSTGPAL